MSRSTYTNKEKVRIYFSRFDEFCWSIGESVGDISKAKIAATFLIGAVIILLLYAAENDVYDGENGAGEDVRLPGNTSEYMCGPVNESSINFSETVCSVNDSTSTGEVVGSAG